MERGSGGVVVRSTSGSEPTWTAWLWCAAWLMLAWTFASRQTASRKFPCDLDDDGRTLIGDAQRKSSTQVLKAFVGGHST